MLIIFARRLLSRARNLKNRLVGVLSRLAQLETDSHLFLAQAEFVPIPKAQVLGFEIPSELASVLLPRFGQTSRPRRDT